MRIKWNPNKIKHWIDLDIYDLAREAKFPYDAFRKLFEAN